MLYEYDSITTFKMLYNIKQRSDNMVNVGDKFGKLTVVELVGAKGEYRNWLCKCDCGDFKTVTTNLLNSGHTKSCGCLYKERSNQHKITHDFSKTKLYKCWTAMKQRCLNSKSPYYCNYGGRGVKVCEDWLSFESFAKWALDNNYSAELTIDRIDVNGDYEPNNCRWVSRKQQANNRRVTRWVVINGERKSISEWCDVYGIKFSTVNNRIWSGWDWVEAITTPLQANKKRA